MQMEELQRELQNCLQEIDYLQDQLNLRTTEAIFMGEHVESLELKLAEVENLRGKLRLMAEGLVRLDSEHLILLKELKYKDEELLRSALQIESLEAVILDSQCEIESMKLDITALEQRCFEADRISQQVAEEKASMNAQLKELNRQLQEMQRITSYLDNGKQEFQEKHLGQKQSLFSIKERFDKWLGNYEEDGSFFRSQSNINLLLRPNTPEDSLAELPSTMAVLTDSNGHLKDEIKKMMDQIRQSDLLIDQLKKDLKEQKLKAKEEAEDLTQEMAELRYQLTEMLEEESKRRALVEQASIQRIQDLEAQVKQEQKKSSATLRHLQEVNELAEKQSKEIKKLRDALEKLHVHANAEDQKLESCPCDYCDKPSNNFGSEALEDSETLEFSEAESMFSQARIGWHSDTL